MKILYLAHRIPYPPNKGDKIRSFNEIKYLSRSHEIDLVCLADDPNDLKHKSDLKKYCNHVFVQPLNRTAAKLKGMLSLIAGKSISVGYFWHKKMQATVNHWLSEKEHEAIICFSSPMAEYVFRAKTNWPEKAQGTRHKVKGKQNEKTNRPTPTSKSFPASQLDSFQPIGHQPILVADFCDLDSDKWRQYSELTKFPFNLIYRTESKRLLQYEKKVNNSFDHSIFVSQNEADLFSKLYPAAKNITVIPNGVDTEYFSPDFVSSTPNVNPAHSNTLYPACPVKREASLSGVKFFEEDERSGFNRGEPSALNPEPCAMRLSPMLLFTGAMDYHANIDGVEWFCNEIFPKVGQILPEAQFLIVGSNPAASVKRLATNNGIQVTGYVDDIRPYYALADICIVPLRLARGVQNKVLEAMAMGKSVVATSNAVQGIMNASENSLFLADTPEDFAEKICLLLADKQQQESLGTNARNFVKENYKWKRNMERLEEMLKAGKRGG